MGRLPRISALITAISFGIGGLMVAAQEKHTEVQTIIGKTEIDAWYDWILVWMFRPGIAAVIVGIFFAFLVPQRIKMDFPMEWTPERRRRMTRRASFVSGFIPTLLLWPLGWMTEHLTPKEHYLIWVAGFLAASAVGTAAPFSYQIIMNFLYRRGWLNEVKWSGEVRARMKRNNIDPKSLIARQEGGDKDAP